MKRVGIVIMFIVLLSECSAQPWYSFGLMDKQEVMPVSKAPMDKTIRKPRIEKYGKLVPVEEDQYIIADGWNMIEADKMISRPVLGEGCDLSQWYNATVPGTVLTTLIDQGVYPDPYVGLNNLSIPDTLCRMDWWYRIEFDLPDRQSAEYVRLIFNGINYRAQIWLNQCYLGIIDGAFIRGVFDVGSLLKRHRNILSVRIIPPNNPGIPQEQTMTDFGPNGGPLCLDGATFFASDGWDWMPAVRDRNIGIWQDVRLSFESPVAIERLQVITDLPLPDTSRASLTIRTSLRNRTASPQKTLIKAHTEDITVSRTVLLQPNETKEVMMSPEELKELTIKNPRLWWPNGYGEQNLYFLNYSAESENGQISRKNVTFGIREMSYELMVSDPEDKQVRIHYSPSDLPGNEGLKLLNDDKNRKIFSESPHVTIPKLSKWPSNGILACEEESENPYLVIRVNGVKIFCRGGNCGMDDALKRVSIERLEPYFKLQKNEGFNMIRNWNGHSTEEAFYDLCDKYGILVWNDFFISTEWWNLRPLFSKPFLANTADVITRFVNHPSIALWCCGNETYAPPLIENGLQQQVTNLDGTRHYQGNSRYLNLTSSGPWRYMPDYRQYYTTIAYGFNTELGAPSMPTYETLCKFIKAEDLWPMNDVWAYHDALFTGWVGWKEYCRDIDAFGDEPCRDAQQFCHRAQILNYTSHRIMFEAWNSRMWDNCSGVLYWMSHPAWYSVVQQSYSWDYKTFGTYFGIKKACEAVHIQWNPVDGTILTVNASNRPSQKVSVELSLWSVSGEMILNKKYSSQLVANGIYQTAEQKLPSDITSPVLVRLEMKNAKGELLSLNDYWCEKEYCHMPYGLWRTEPPQLNFKVLKDNCIGNAICISLENKGKKAAPFIEIDITDRTDGASLLPVYISDSYINLLPGEKRMIKIELPDSHIGKKIGIKAAALNAVTIKEISVRI